MIKKILLFAAIAALASATWYLADLPDTRQLRTVNPVTSAIRIARENQIRKKGGTPHSQMTWRRLSDISPHLWHAVILAEDDTFFQHNGFDVEQLKRAVRVNWRRKRMAFGASTLTQQLARTLYLSSHKNLLRKAKEALIARRLERTLSKQRILELYLNVVEWGPNVYGAEAAARHFFGTSAAALTPDQAIALAVILPSPRRWDPLSEKKFIAQRKVILYERMVRAHYLPSLEPTVVISAPTPTELEELPVEEGEPETPEELSPAR